MVMPTPTPSSGPKPTPKASPSPSASVQPTLAPGSVNTPTAYGSTGPYGTGMVTGGGTNLALTIRADGSVYDTAFNMADAQQFAAAGSAYFDKLKITNVYGSAYGFSNDLEYLQASVRSMGISKGTSNVGQLSLEDYNAIQKVFQTSYLRGTDWATTISSDMASPYSKGSGTSGFNKSITSALSMLDATDAEARLSNAYYQAFGVYPGQQKIERFRDKFNAELKAQTGKTTTTTSSAGRGSTSTSSVTKSVTEGLGFTETEQNQFLADFLKANYKITGAEQSGYVKSVITNLQNLYKSNLLPEDSMENMIAFAAELVGTADQNVATQKFTAKSDSIRAIAAKLNPGVADLLTNGQNISDVLDPIVKGVNNSLGTAFTKEDSRFKEVLNFNDGKTTRAMTTTEIDKFISKQPEYQTSAAGINKYASWGQALKDALR